MGVTKGSLDESVWGVTMMLCVTMVLVTCPSFLTSVISEEMVRGEVTVSCIEDALDGERFMNWVVGINLSVALCDDRLNGQVEPFEKGGIVLIVRDAVASE